MMTVEDELYTKASDGVVFIVHGIGTGALRTAVHTLLKKKAHVKSFHLEPDSRGGCTVVVF